MTDVQGLQTTSAPILDDVFYTAAVAGALIGRTANAVSICLHRFPEMFDPPHYQRFHGLPRRLLTSRDVATLRAMYPVYVKPKVSVSKAFQSPSCEEVTRITT